MKGDAKLLKKLNDLLADELTAINQYMVHSEMCDGWGYERLHRQIEKRAIQEMKHAEMLIKRILFFEGTPVVRKLNKIRIGADVAKQFANDLMAEHGALEMYNEAIRLADQVKDAPTRNLLEQIARDEDDHIDWLEEQLDQVKQLSLQFYLSTQIKKHDKIRAATPTSRPGRSRGRVMRPPPLRTAVVVHFSRRRVVAPHPPHAPRLAQQLLDRG
jgi:bacterioferritin